MSPLVFCNHTVNLETDSKTLLQFTEKKMYSFCCKSQQTLKEISVVQQQPQEQLPERSHKQDILQKQLQSIFASYGMHTTNYFCVFGNFYASGTQDTEVTKSLIQDCNNFTP